MSINLRVKIGHMFDDRGFYVSCMVWVDGKLINTPGYLEIVDHEQYIVSTDYTWTVCTYKVPVGSSVLFKAVMNGRNDLIEMRDIKPTTQINFSGHDSYGWMMSVKEEDLNVRRTS